MMLGELSLLGNHLLSIYLGNGRLFGVLINGGFLGDGFDALRNYFPVEGFPQLGLVVVREKRGPRVPRNEKRLVLVEDPIRDF